MLQAVSQQTPIGQARQGVVERPSSCCSVKLTMGVPVNGRWAWPALREELLYLIKLG
jgi:hypothetical protein